MLGAWNYMQGIQFPYGKEETYRRAIEFLDIGGIIQDWGCGTAYAKRFVQKSSYTGIDGSKSGFENKIVDLRTFTSNPTCILMRHILEHNYDWAFILENALQSFQKRMALVMFMSFSPDVTRVAHKETSELVKEMPFIVFKKEDLLNYISPFLIKEEDVANEHIFYLEK